MRAPVTAVAAFALVTVMAAFRPPWQLMLLMVSLALFATAWAARHSLVRAVIVNLAAAALALAAFEAYLASKAAAGDGTRLEGSINEDFTVRDELLGYRPRPGRQVTARKFYGNTVLYDVVYTIGADGLRITPSGSHVTSSGCVAFFGDSVTFGEGVADQRAYPFRVGELLGAGFSAHNFAYSGYGPHQMLAILEARDIDTRISCTPTHFIYLAILEHVARVAGLASWDRHGPRYRIGSEGAPVRDGNFDLPSIEAKGWQPPEALAGWLVGYRTWQRFFGRARDPDRADLDLFLAVVREAARRSTQHYPGAKFEVVLWDGRDDERLAIIERGLLQSGIRVHRITTILPEFTAGFERYVLSPHDGHPNERMHEAVAQYVARDVILK